MDKNVAGKSFFLGFDLLTAADDHFTLDGDNGLKNFVGKIHGFNSGFERVDDLVFVAGIGVNYKPGGVDGDGSVVGKWKEELFLTGLGGSVWHINYGFLVVEAEAVGVWGAIVICIFWLDTGVGLLTWVR